VKAARENSVDVHEARKAAYLEGWSKGHDDGWEAGVQAVMEQFREAGIDVDAVLALDAEDEPGDVEA
jgi:hypothetical protein